MRFIIAAFLIWLAACLDPSGNCSHDWKTRDYRNITYVAPLATPTEYQKDSIYLTDTPEHEVCIRCGSERYNKWDGTKIIYGEVLKR